MEQVGGGGGVYSGKLVQRLSAMSECIHQGYTLSNKKPEEVMFFVLIIHVQRNKIVSGREGLKRQRLLSLVFVADANSKGEVEVSRDKCAWGTVTSNLCKTEGKQTNKKDIF